MPELTNENLISAVTILASGIVIALIKDFIVKKIKYL